MSSLPPDTPRLWSLSDPYKIQIPLESEEPSKGQKSSESEELPKEDEDLWTTLCRDKREIDNAYCEVWKDEIQNLLIFAGLFSAVVTTFVVDSYKSLQPDSQADSVVLLAQLVSHFAPDDHNNSISIAPIPPFTPSQSAVRVNTLWFLSLVLSLCTASAGITALQWIRAFQHHNSGLTSKQDFALLNLRSESFINWAVPGIIATLPFLIQLALILFFLGLADFLSNSVSSHVATGPTIVSGIFVLLFFLFTFLPGIQYRLLRFGVLGRHVPTPCPYRSPAAQAYMQHFYQIGRVIRETKFLLLPRVLVGLALFAKEFSIALVKSRFRLSEVPMNHLCQSYITDIWRGNPLELVPYDRPWSTEVEWLVERDDSSHVEDKDTDLEVYGSDHIPPYTKLIPVEYDAARGLGFMARVSRGATHPSILYHCFHELLARVKRKSFFDRLWLEGGLSIPGPWVEDLYEDPDQRLIQTQASMFFLSSFEQTRIASPKQLFADHQLELCVRVMGGTFIATDKTPLLKKEVARRAASDLDVTHSDFWVPWLLRRQQLDQLGQLVYGDEIRQQILLVYEAFVSSWSQRQPPTPINKFHTFQQIEPFSAITACLIFTILCPSQPSDPNPSDPHPTSLPQTEEQEQKQQHFRSVVEAIGVRINTLFIDFLLSGPGPAEAQAEPGPDPFHRTTLYLAATVYIAHFISEIRKPPPPPSGPPPAGSPQIESDTKRRRLTLDLVVEVFKTCPKYSSSFIMLLAAWALKTSEMNGINRVEIFGFVGWLGTRTSEITNTFAESVWARQSDSDLVQRLLRRVEARPNWGIGSGFHSTEDVGRDTEGATTEQRDLEGGTTMSLNEETDRYVPW